MPPVAGGRRWPVLAAALVTTFLAAMEANVVATAMPTIVGALGGMELYPWVFAVYVAATTLTTPIYGKLADLFGRKRTLMAGAGLFLLGSALCATATSMPALILFRALQGTGAGAILPVVLTIIGDLYTVEERARLQGLLGSVWGFSALVGPTLGYLVVSSLGWRWIFLINLPVGGLALVLLGIFLRERLPGHRPVLDWLGAALLMGAVGALLAATGRAGTAGWTDPWVAGLMAAALVLGLAFVRQERRAPEPLLPLSLFRVPLIAASSLANIFFGVVLIAAQSHVPLLTSDVLGAGERATATVMGALSLGWPVASFFSARLLLTLGYRTMAVAGQAVQLAATLAVMLAGPATPLWRVAATVFLLGAGFGIANPAYLIGVQTAVPWHRRGVATSTLQFVRALGQTLGGAVLSSMFTAGTAAVAPLGGAARQAALDRVLDRIFLTVAAGALLAAAAALAMPRVRPGREQEPAGTGAVPAGPD